jgi:hypothetical protein
MCEEDGNFEEHDEEFNSRVGQRFYSVNIDIIKFFSEEKELLVVAVVYVFVKMNLDKEDEQIQSDAS